jgi:hypothetical protein
MGQQPLMTAGHGCFRFAFVGATIVCGADALRRNDRRIYFSAE